MIAANLAVSALLQWDRAARLVDFKARDARHPSIGEVFGALVRRAFPAGAAGDDAQARAIRRAVQTLVATRLMELGADRAAAYEVRAAARAALGQVRAAVAGRPDAVSRALADDVARYLAKPDEATRPAPPLRTPAGEPIG